MRAAVAHKKNDDRLDPASYAIAFPPAVQERQPQPPHQLQPPQQSPPPPQMLPPATPADDAADRRNPTADDAAVVSLLDPLSASTPAACASSGSSASSAPLQQHSARSTDRKSPSPQPVRPRRSTPQLADRLADRRIHSNASHCQQSHHSSPSSTPQTGSRADPSPHTAATADDPAAQSSRSRRRQRSMAQSPQRSPRSRLLPCATMDPQGFAAAPPAPHSQPSTPVVQCAAPLFRPAARPPAPHPQPPRPPRHSHGMNRPRRLVVRRDTDWLRSITFAVAASSM